MGSHDRGRLTRIRGVARTLSSRVNISIILIRWRFFRRLPRLRPDGPAVPAMRRSARVRRNDRARQGVRKLHAARSMRPREAVTAGSGSRRLHPVSLVATTPLPRQRNIPAPTRESGCPERRLPGDSVRRPEVSSRGAEEDRVWTSGR